MLRAVDVGRGDRREAREVGVDDGLPVGHAGALKKNAIGNERADDHSDLERISKAKCPGDGGLALPYGRYG